MKTAIIGCGTIAAVHAKCISRLPELELTAFVDIKPERAGAFVKEYGGRAYRSLEELLQNEQVDVVHICTPHYLHTPMAIYALEHGVNIFMEKPPVISWEQLEQLKTVKTDKRLGFCFQNRYNPSVIKVKEMIESGVTGRVIGARGIVTWNRGEAYYTESGWRGSLATEGGGVLINQSIHTMDLLHYLIGQTVQSVDAVITNHHLKGVIEVEDTMSAYIRYPEAVACFYATSSYIADPAPLIEINCENMTLRIEELNVTCFHKNGDAEQIPVEGKKGYGKSYWGAGHEDCITDFYDCLKNNRRFALDLTEMQSTIQLMLAAYESARSGREVTLQN